MGVLSPPARSVCESMCLFLGYLVNALLCASARRARSRSTLLSTALRSGAAPPPAICGVKSPLAASAAALPFGVGAVLVTEPWAGAASPSRRELTSLGRGANRGILVWTDTRGAAL